MVPTTGLEFVEDFASVRIWLTISTRAHALNWPSSTKMHYDANYLSGNVRKLGLIQLKRISLPMRPALKIREAASNKATGE